MQVSLAQLCIAENETKKLFADVASTLPQIEDMEKSVEDEGI